MTKKKSRTSHHVIQIFVINFFKIANKKIYLANDEFGIFAENVRKSLKVFDNWLRTGKNDLG